MHERRILFYFILLAFSISTVSFARTIKIVDYQVVVNNSSDSVATKNKTQIQLAFNDAKQGDQIEFPNGTIYYKGNFNIKLKNKSSINLYGSGMNNSILASKDPSYSAIQFMNCSYIVVRDLQVYSPYTTDMCTDCDSTASGFYIDGYANPSDAHNIEFRSVKVNNTRTSGIVFYYIKQSGVWNSQIVNIHGAGIQINEACSTMNIEYNYVYNTCDDNIATVGTEGHPNSSIGIKNNTLSYAGVSSRSGSGITVEGSNFVEVHNNTIDHSDSAGIRVASEGTWHAGGVNEVDVKYNVVSYSPKKTNHPSILVYTSTNYDVKNVHITDNQIWYPQTSRGIALYGENPGNGQVHDCQVIGNPIYDYLRRIQVAVFVGQRTYNLTIYNNPVYQ